MPEKLSKDSKKAHASFRRLLISKQLYLHGMEHSYKEGALNKMVAVHNLHNALEIALKAIRLHYDIRREKEFNISFDAMLNEIDKFFKSKKNDNKLPYRQDLRILNEVRNQIQHHAVEPANATLEDYRVLARRFLESVCQQYFELDFNALSQVDMIDDDLLRGVLSLSLDSIDKKKFSKSVTLAKFSFELASRNISKFLQKNELNFDFPYQTRYSHVEKAIENLKENDSKTRYFVCLLSSGVNFVDYKRFLDMTPSLGIARSGVFEALWFGEET